MRSTIYNIIKIIRWIFEMRDPDAQRRIDHVERAVDITDIYKACGSFEGIVISKDIAYKDKLTTSKYDNPILIFGFVPMVTGFGKMYGRETYTVDHTFYFILDIVTMNIVDVIYKYHDKSSMMHAFEIESMFSSIVGREMFSSAEIDMNRLRHLAKENKKIYRKIRLEFNGSVFIEVTH